MKDYFKFAYSTESVKNIERQLINDGTKSFLLMMRAAQVTYKHLLKKSADNIIIFCGKGNNGGDGYGLAALLFMENLKVDVFQVEKPSTPEANLARKLCINLGIDIREWKGYPKIGSWYIDALFGSGISRDPNDKYKNAIDFINAEKNLGKNVLSLDIPSGINGTTGEVYKPAVQASETMTFLGMKQGLLTGEAVDYTGKIIFNNLGIKKHSFKPDAQILEKKDCDFAVIKPSAHKGTRGNILMVGGMRGMEGAGILAGLASLKAGAGKVFWSTDTKSLQRPPELITIEPKIEDVLDLVKISRVCILGPGLGSKFDNIIEVLWNSNIPIVLDADGLRWLAKKRPLKRDAEFVATPHPGEARELIQGENLNRFETLLSLQKSFGGQWVLKGAGTLILESKKLWINNLNMPQLGTAGSGDILAGFIAGAWSLGSVSPARTGVWLHSFYAQKTLRRKVTPFLTASDLLN